MNHVLLHVLDTCGECRDGMYQVQHLLAQFILASNRSPLQHILPPVNLLHRLPPLLLDLIKLLLVLLLPLSRSLRHFPQQW